MGGAIFTLADFALALASNIGMPPSVSVSSAIDYMKRGLSERIRTPDDSDWCRTATTRAPCGALAHAAMKRDEPLGHGGLDGGGGHVLGAEGVHPDAHQDALREAIIETVIRPVFEAEGVALADDCEIYVNPTGRFVIGGPMGDASKDSSTPWAMSEDCS